MPRIASVSDAVVDGVPIKRITLDDDGPEIDVTAGNYNMLVAGNPNPDELGALIRNYRQPENVTVTKENMDTRNRNEPGGVSKR